ncbi:MAG: Ribokinase [Lentisphaerae bacterium ADurb.BinA184]|nr:MAG: Ribokinase [Lentisphaerae bacterium ADurb.BinA184]
MPPALLHGVLNVGSINEDRVYRVHSIARPGETVCGLEYRVFAGGKGANQSVALARAGARVRHVGKVGNGGAWLRDKLAGCGVGVRHVTVADAPTGHAVIQVDASGENSIVLFPGTNHQITADERRQALDGAAPGDWLLLQNEVNDIPDLMAMGRERGLRIVLNPAPMTTPVRAYPLELADLLILNETEGEALTGEGEPSRLLDALRRRLPAATIVLTLGAAGARVAERDGDASPVATPHVQATDTTGAGDTFVGYCLALLIEGRTPVEAARYACRAAALSVTRPGAMDSIPRRDEVESWIPPLRSPVV